ncbi:PepSY domain-containing protein [Oceanobacillus locisalsi]|uniref:PepSY domain-containing protein n=1 Tax=Oceanobacillus locisalsi TaxID=546107 RepID=A0ABW3NL13_9BACI
MNKKIGIIVGAVALTGVVGTGIYHAEASGSNEEQIQITETENENVATEDVAKKLEEEYQGTIKELELDKEDNNLYYEAEIIADNQEYDVVIDAATGEVVHEEKDDDDRDEERNMEGGQQEASEGNENNHADKNNIIAQNEAIEIAKQEFDGEVVELELDYDDGRYVYEMELANGEQEADIDIHGETGDILSLEVDYEDD